MDSLSAEEVLQLWERGESEARIERALALAAHARPELAPSDLAALTVGEGQLAVLGLRARMFGRNLQAVASCPACQAAVEFNIDLRRLMPPGRGEGTGGAGMHTGEFDGWQVQYRVPTMGDLASLARDFGPAQAGGRGWLLERCVLEARSPDGVASSGAHLPAGVGTALAAAMAERDWAAELATDLVCPECSHAWRATLDAADFCWSELSALARRLLREVHELAARYGWSEADILRLSAHRRHAYLERIWS